MSNKNEKLLLNEPVHFDSDTVLILKPEQPFFYQQCCDCNLVHRVELSPRYEDVRMKFVRVGHGFPLNEFIPTTYIATSSDAPKLPILERLETLWEQHNSRLNTIIGKATVPAMRSGDPMAKEVHQDLIDFANWFDEMMEGVDES